MKIVQRPFDPDKAEAILKSMNLRRIARMTLLGIVLLALGFWLLTRIP